jgi:hypothetical protein
VNTAQEIIDFARNRMRMSHVYQPLLIRALVRSGGSATLRQLATALLVEDESQLRYYEERIKKISAPLIYQHRISERDRLIAEAVGKLAEQELSRLTAHRARNGDETS